MTEAAGGVPGSAPAGQDIVRLLDDAWEVIVSLESEGWDLLSQETRNESASVRDRIQASTLGRRGLRHWD